MMRIYDGRLEFYQWDTNQKITSNTFNVGDEIHFFNIRQTNSLVVLAYELDNKTVADVPNILLQNSYPIIAYRVHVDDDGKSTIEEQQFKVKQKPKPEDYVYTETEVLNYSNLNDRVTTLENNGVSTELVNRLVSEYLSANPVIETDPNVPDWAKQPNKPTYTADEVGAISQDNLQNAINEALAQAKASGEFDGKDGADGAPGKDGTSATHSWNGTVLSITSASGTSSADLKGEKGDTGPQGDTGAQGEKGDKGDKGADGYTPVKGTDYFTEADKSEIVNTVLAALPAAEGVNY